MMNAIQRIRELIPSDNIAMVRVDDELWCEAWESLSDLTRYRYPKRRNGVFWVNEPHFTIGAEGHARPIAVCRKGT